jgi:DNA ligase (NAD+)
MEHRAEAHAMTAANVEREAARLRAEIERHNHLYYIDAAPEISDRAFDELLKKLEAIEAEHPELVTPDSPTRRVGGAPVPEFRTVEHAVPMLSIDNTYSFDEVRAWDARVRKGLNPGETVRYVVELKVDGVAVSLRYEQGILVLGATRGDGSRGDDITANIRTVRTVPLRLDIGTGPAPEVLEVRGEVFMTNAELVRLNAVRAEAEETKFANPRNATAGSLKLLDSRLCGQRRLRFAAHGLGETRGLIDPCSSYWSMLQRLRDLGLPTTPEPAVYDSIDGVIEHARTWDDRRNTLGFQTDGLVIKVDDLSQRNRLGTRSKSPRWVIAFKYSAEQAVTKITGIRVQVGKTGRLTPVADLEAVELAGTTVRRATLHNIDEIARKGVLIGDSVLIQKAGEIIPQVVRVEVEARTGDEVSFTFPTACPSCGAPVEREADEVDFRCSNPPTRCPAQLDEVIRWFAHRDGMDIDGLGEKIIAQLTAKGLVRGPADLYRLDAATLADLDRMGTKSAENLVAAIASRRERPLDRFLAALAIRHVGSRVAEILAERFVTLEALRGASLDDLAATPGLGPIVATSVFEAFRAPDFTAMLDDLLAVGVRPTPYEAAAVSSGTPSFQGMTFVITGTLPRRSRGEAEAFIKMHGGKVTGSVSKSTSYVVAGEEAGSKLDKARQLGITVLDEDGLDQLAGP